MPPHNLVVIAQKLIPPGLHLIKNSAVVLTAILAGNSSLLSMNPKKLIGQLNLVLISVSEALSSLTENSINQPTKIYGGQATGAVVPFLDLHNISQLDIT
jgi:hypothetical protein